VSSFIHSWCCFLHVVFGFGPHFTVAVAKYSTSLLLLLNFILSYFILFWGIYLDSCFFSGSGFAVVSGG
jgi:hypothetical protein